MILFNISKYKYKILWPISFQIDRKYFLQLGDIFVFKSVILLLLFLTCLISITNEYIGEVTLTADN